MYLYILNILSVHSNWGRQYYSPFIDEEMKDFAKSVGDLQVNSDPLILLFSFQLENIPALSLHKKDILSQGKSLETDHELLEL